MAPKVDPVAPRGPNDPLDGEAYLHGFKIVLNSNAPGNSLRIVGRRAVPAGQNPAGQQIITRMVVIVKIDPKDSLLTLKSQTLMDFGQGPPRHAVITLGEDFPTALATLGLSELHEVVPVHNAGPANTLFGGNPVFSVTNPWTYLQHPQGINGVLPDVLTCFVGSSYESKWNPTQKQIAGHLREAVDATRNARQISVTGWIDVNVHRLMNQLHELDKAHPAKKLRRQDVLGAVQEHPRTKDVDLPGIGALSLADLFPKVFEVK
jgi:hypothetical protein